MGKSDKIEEIDFLLQELNRAFKNENRYFIGKFNESI